MAETINFAGRSLELGQNLTGPELRVLMKEWNKEGGHDELVSSVLMKCFRDHEIINTLSKRQLAGLFLRLLEYHQKKRKR